MDQDTLRGPYTWAVGRCTVNLEATSRSALRRLNRPLPIPGARGSVKMLTAPDRLVVLSGASSSLPPLGSSQLLSVPNRIQVTPRHPASRTVLGKRCVTASFLVILDILSSSISHYLLAYFLPVPRPSCSVCLKLWQRMRGTADPETSSSAI